MHSQSDKLVRYTRKPCIFSSFVIIKHKAKGKIFPAFILRDMTEWTCENNAAFILETGTSYVTVILFTFRPSHSLVNRTYHKYWVRDFSWVINSWMCWRRKSRCWESNPSCPTCSRHFTKLYHFMFVIVDRNCMCAENFGICLIREEIKCMNKHISLLMWIKSNT
jgi:hypothetical protein